MSKPRKPLRSYVDEAEAIAVAVRDKDPDLFDSYMAARLGKPVAQITAALDADDRAAAERTFAFIDAANRP